MTYLDNEVDRVNEDPKASHEDRQAAESWRATWESRWSEQVKSQAATREQAKIEKQVRLYEALRASQKEADANRSALAAGEISVPEFLNVSARLDLKAAEYERRLQGLQSAESIIEEMRGDPVRWQDNFFEKWTTLRRSRPDLDGWLHESREKRRRDRGRQSSR